MTDEARKARAEYQKNWYRNHPGKGTEYCRRWRNKHPEQAKQNRDNYWERKAAALQAESADH